MELHDDLGDEQNEYEELSLEHDQADSAARHRQGRCVHLTGVERPERGTRSDRVRLTLQGALDLVDEAGQKRVVARVLVAGRNPIPHPMEIIEVRRKRLTGQAVTAVGPHELLLRNGHNVGDDSVGCARKPGRIAPDTLETLQILEALPVAHRSPS
jgi:hypothetical protein